MINIANFRGIIQNTLYSDRLEIYRYVKTTNPNGTTSIDLSEDPSAVNIPCKVSHKSNDSPSYNYQRNPEESEISLSVDIYQDIRKGDNLKVYKIEGENVIGIFEGVASEPMLHQTHKRLYLLQEGDG